MSNFSHTSDPKKSAVPQPTFSGRSAPSSTLAGAPASLQRVLGNHAVSRLLQRSIRVGEKEDAAGYAGGEVERTTGDAIEAARSGGRPLPRSVQKIMAPVLGGVDLSPVRVHSDAQANKLSLHLNAAAFTTGRDIFFARGAYQPESTKGQALLAHELTHTVQQGAVGRSPLAPSPVAQRSLASLIQRLRWDDDPLDLTPTPNRTATKSAGGAAAGVYFVTEGGETVVVKFLDGQEALRSQAGNRFMAEGVGPNVQTPQSRVFAPASAQAQAVKDAIVAHSQLDLPGTAPHLIRVVNPRLKTDFQGDTAPGKAVMIMSPVQQTSLRQMAQAPAQHGQLVALLTRASVIDGFAKIIVADAVLGNSDRFMKDMMPTNPIVDSPANISNVFVNPAFTQAVALDNEVDRSPALTQQEMENNPAALVARRNYLSNALMNRTIGWQIAEAVVCAILMDVGELDDGQPIVPGLSRSHLGAVPPRQLTETMAANNVVETMGEMLTTALKHQLPEVLGNMRRARGRLRGEFEQAEQGAGLEVTTTTASYNMLRGRAKYLAKLAKGKSQVAAAQAALKHIAHKQRKDEGELGYQKAGQAMENAGEVVKGSARIAASKISGLFKK